MNVNIAMIVIFLLITIIIFGGTFFQYRKHKSNLDSHLNSLNFFHKKPDLQLLYFSITCLALSCSHQYTGSLCGKVVSRFIIYFSFY